MPGHHTLRSAVKKHLALILLCITVLPLPAKSQSKSNTEALLSRIVERLLASEARQSEKISDVKMDSELIERRLKGNGEVKEEKRFIKEIYFHKIPDSTRKMEVYERYLAYYKDGERQSADELADIVKEKIKKLKKGRGDDKARLVTDVFLPQNAEFYSLSYGGIVDSAVDNYTCYIIKVRAKENKEDLKERINAEFYIDTVSARPVFVTFRPARFKGNMMFKFKKLEMSLEFKEFQPDVWMPVRFHLRGKAKAALFFGVDFEADEIFSNPQFNTGVEGIPFAELMGT